MNVKAVAVAALLACLVPTEAPAQIIIGPPPPAPGFGYGGSAVRVTYRSGNFAVTGYIGGGYYYPAYPPPYSQTTIVTPAPRVTINNNYFGGSPPVLGTGYDQDTRGVDLDAVAAKKPRSTEAEPAPAKPLPGVDVSTPKPPVRPGDPGQQPKPPAKEAAPKPPREFPPPPEPLPNPRDESNRLIELGTVAFQAGDYGIAALRFSQATALTPLDLRARFLLAQAEIAMGKFRDAVQTIHAG